MRSSSQKCALLEFLFGSTQGIESTYPGSSPALDAKIQNLQNQVNFLQQKVINLEAKREYITSINPTSGQIEDLESNGNIGLDTRPSMQLTLRFRGLKNSNL